MDMMAFFICPWKVTTLATSTFISRCVSGHRLWTATVVTLHSTLFEEDFGAGCGMGCVLRNRRRWVLAKKGRCFKMWLSQLKKKQVTSYCIESLWSKTCDDIIWLLILDVILLLADFLLLSYLKFILYLLLKQMSMNWTLNNVTLYCL